jgi:ribulose-phosphate 3-epimerase
MDGNVTMENAVKMRKAGADLFVAGTSLLFRPGDKVLPYQWKLRVKYLCG